MSGSERAHLEKVIDRERQRKALEKRLKEEEEAE
jgi:hypothetical protein